VNEYVSTFREVSFEPQKNMKAARDTAAIAQLHHAGLGTALQGSCFGARITCSQYFPGLGLPSLSHSVFNVGLCTSISLALA
jgi:hypothetical protein